MKNTKKIITYVLLISMSLIMLFPLFWLLSSSFKELDEIFTFPPTLLVKNPTIQNYVTLFKDYNFLRPLLNSLYISVIYTVLSVFFCSLAGYAFSKYKFKGKNLLFALVLGSLMIPIETTMIPTFTIFKQLGWMDKHIGLIIPGMVNAFGIFFMTQYMQGISKEIMEAGRLDGCSEFGIFIRLILPIIKPAIASLGIIFFMNSWNNFLWPLIILNSPDKLTLAVALRSLLQGVRTPHHLVMAGAVVSIAPLVIIFIIFQKYFIAGITEGSVKE